MMQKLRGRYQLVVDMDDYFKRNKSPTRTDIAIEIRDAMAVSLGMRVGSVGE
jgi:hypothetical protein